MFKKNLLQLFLIFILFFSFFLLYQKYFKKSTQIDEDNKVENKIIDPKQKNVQENKENVVEELGVNEDQALNEKSNILKNIKYTSKDEEGNIYEIYAKKGVLDLIDPNITSMDEIVAKIFIVDGSVINIESKHAIYNRKNYNTNFSGNVRLKYLSHYVNCEKVDILFDKNLAALYENLIYKNKKTRLKADRMEVDLITKNSKIFMYNNNNKISIVSKN